MRGPSEREGPSPRLEIDRIRRDFPALGLEVHGHPLVYLDNAATTQKPEVVLEAEDRWYREMCSNVHRGVHDLSQKATDAYETARAKAQQFINASSSDEVIFVRGTTEGINLVASTYGRQHVGAGDEVLISEMEHHSNIVPWQILCEEKGATLRVAPIDDRGQLIVDHYEALLSERTKVVGVTYVSNALGTINPLPALIEMAHARGAVVVVDGAQAVPHLDVDVQALDSDFFAFSGHKMYGPTGIGVLHGKLDLLRSMPPYQGGGEMIRSVTFEKTEFAEPPARYEAGTPNIAGAVALGAAIDYLTELGIETVARHEQEILAHATAVMNSIPGVRIIGTADHKASVLSFVMEGVHAHDVGTILDRQGIAIRAGHHCAQPVMEHFGVPATGRASFALFNTLEDANRLAEGVTRVQEVFG